MASELVEIADAVVTALNAQLPAWGFTQRASRRFMPTLELKELAEPTFTVLVNSTTQRIISTTSFGYTHKIDVDIRRHVGNEINGAFSTQLIELCEKIGDFALGKTFDEYAYAEANCTEVETTVPFQTDEMQEKHVFAAVATLTFEVWRTPK